MMRSTVIKRFVNPRFWPGFWKFVLNRLSPLALAAFICMPSFVTASQNHSISAETMLSRSLEKLLPSDQAGVVIGTIDKNGQRVHMLGNSSFDETTLFEYGSITKVFTAILLQKWVNKGTVHLDDSVYPYLPKTARTEKWQSVSFKNLATHTAGIPGLPPNLHPILLWLRGQGHDPYAHYDEAALYKGVKKTKVKGVGEVWNYSNYGFALLGNLLTKMTGLSYDTLLAEHFFTPLKMTTASTTEFSSDHIAPPLADSGRVGDHWTLNAFAPAGTLKGSMTDALKFLAASMQACQNTDELSMANCQAQQSTGIQAAEDMRQGLAWVRSRSSAKASSEVLAQRPDSEIVWHNGGTGGYSSFLGFIPDQEVGIVLLMNVAEVDLTRPALAYLGSL